MSLRRTGVPTKKELSAFMPSKGRLSKGPVAVIECLQKIPCDPCASACKRGAILPMKDLNQIPEMDEVRCNGCGRCVSLCPGLAIFVVDESYTTERGLVKLPYEFLPMPRKGERVTLLSRAGEEIGQGEVVKVVENRSRTAVLSILVPIEKVMDVRNIRRERMS